MSFLKTRVVLEALTKRLAGLRFPDDLQDGDNGLDPLAGELVFQQVTLSDQPDIGLVLQRLILVDERVAAVVPGVETYEEDRDTGRLLQHRMFTIMMSANDFDPFEDPAFFGTSGLITMSELTRDALLQPFGDQRSPLRMARVRPVRGGSQLVVQDGDDSPAGREVYFLEIKVRTGSGHVCK